MPCFPRKFADNINLKKEKFYNLFTKEPRNSEEASLKEKISYHWCVFPTLPPTDIPVYAVDGSNACLAIQGGRYISIVQAILQGKDWQEVEVDVEAFRDSAKVDVERFHQVHRQLVEWKIARENAEKMANSFLFLDGSLYISPVIYSWAQIVQRMPEGLEDIPLIALEEFLSLVDASIRHNIKLVGISKTSKSHFYPRVLLQKETEITDSEVFTFWTEGKGFSTPLLVGPHFIPQPWERVKGEFLRSFHSLERERVDILLENLLPNLAVVVFFIRFEEGDEVYRIDVLSSSLDMKVQDFEMAEIRFLEEEIVHPILGVLLSSHGGFNVYHNLLYVAHNEIILRDRDQDVYISLLRELTNLPIRRSKVDTRFGRRF